MTNREQYIQFIKQVPDFPVFLQPWYLDAVVGNGNWEVVFAKRKERTVAVLPYFLKKKGVFKYITMPHFVKHMGTVILPEYRKIKYEHVFQEELISQLPKINYFIQDFHPSITNWLPFYWKGYHQTTRYTYRLEDLSDTGKVFSGINRNMRRNIKKANQQVEIVHDLPITRLFEMLKKGFDRQKIAFPFSLAFFEKHIESLKWNNACKLFFAIDKKGVLHSASCLIWDNQTAYYHLAGDDPEKRESGASILLTWEAIKYTAEVLKLEVFDFEGSMLKNIEAIRRQFGATQIPYHRVWKYHSHLFRFFHQL